MQLYNKLSSKEREELIEQAGEERFTLSFTSIIILKTPRNFETTYLLIGMHWMF